MSPYRVLPHQADIRLSVSGDSLHELFHAALEGMSEILKPGFCRLKHARDERAEVVLTAPDQTTLLIDFLSDVLTRSEERRTVFCEVKFDELSERSLRARLAGARVDGFSEDIKAVTYHEAEIRENERGRLETMIVFDI